MIDIISIAKICGAIMGILVFLLYVAKIHRDLFIVPLFKQELGTVQSQITIVTRMLREKYREEYEQAEEDILRENKMKGIL